MSLYLPGIEMPTSCNNCQIRNGVFCPIRNALADRDGKRCDCPLISVPEHGRLGDLDVLAQKCDDPYWCVWLSDIEDAPTIIPADPVKEGDG